jgi:hypothetical protein
VGVRSAATILASAGLALLAAGCGGSSGSRVAQLARTTTHTRITAPSNSGSGKPRALEFSQCMRSHGVPKFPDISNLAVLRGGSPKIAASMQQLGVSSSQFEAAESACRHLLPNGGKTTPAESQQDLDAMRGFARCMRSHGVPTWPDPTNGPAGWGFDLVNVRGFDPNSPQIDSKMSICQRHLPPGIGIPLSRPGSPG